MFTSSMKEESLKRCPGESSMLENECEASDIEMLKLKQENYKLKEKLQAFQLHHKRLFPDDEVIAVVFKNEEVEIKYKNSVEMFLRNLLHTSEKYNILHDISKDNVVEKGNVKISFCIDTDNFSLEKKRPVTCDVPLYNSSFDEALESYSVDRSQECDKTDDIEIQQMIKCFNCLGSHHLKDCPEKHDRMKIAENRSSFQESFQNSCRYHQDEGQKNNLHPGRISEKLREALGLRYNQLPLYIYHMRILGYPPGWMKEAEIEDSGLNLYDSEGNADSNGDLDLSAKKKRYNGQKFVAFPGFNTPVPDDMLDEWENLKMIPIQSHQQLAEALKHAGVKIGDSYKKRKFKSETDNEAKKKNGVTNLDDSSNSSLSQSCSALNIINENNVSFSPDADEMTKGSKDRKSVSVISGTSIIDTGNPCKKLPDSQKFAVGITEHMPYENLPDAVGTFDKMREILSKVREKLENQSEI